MDLKEVTPDAYCLFVHDWRRLTVVGVSKGYLGCVQSFCHGHALINQKYIRHDRDHYTILPMALL